MFFVFIPSFIDFFTHLIFMLYLNKLTCINNMHKSLILSVFISIFSTSAIADWDVTYTVPELSTKYYRAIEKQETLIITYTNKVNSQFPLPIQPINPQHSILLKTLLPPGTVLATLNGQSNFFAQKQSFRAAYFDQDPGEFCGDNSDVCQDNKLSYINDVYNPTIYNETKILNDPKFILQQPEYRYIVFKWTGSGAFSFTSLQIQMVISDITLYNEWRNNRPWAGGPTSNSLDGIAGDTIELSITPPSNGSITIKTANEIDKTCTQLEDKDCKTTHSKDSELELTAEAVEGFVFKEWQGSCTTNSKIDGNKITFTMNISKTCSALFQEKPMTLTITEPYPTNGFIINNVSNEILINENLFADNPNKYILCRDGMDKDLCDADYIKNTPAILVAVPDMGYTLDAWGEDCTGTDSYVVLTMDEDKNCSATFKECN